MSRSFGLLILRVAFGGAMLYVHGWDKFLGRETMAATFPDPIGLGHTVSFWCAVAAEVAAAAALVLGLGTRLAALGLAFTMGVAFFVFHQTDPIAKKELALLYLAAYSTLVFTGAGEFSLDHLIFGKKRGQS